MYNSLHDFCYPVIIIAAFLLLTTTAAQSQHNTSQQEEFVWPAITPQNKPWTRWWWQGSAVTESGIRSELEAYFKAGFGGVELTPIYGVKGEEDNFIDYLSEDWVDALEYTLQIADSLGMQVDMATGTGWPFGGPWIGSEQACKNVVHETYEVDGGTRVNLQLAKQQSPLLRTVRRLNLDIDDIEYPISKNENLQELALDQVRFPVSLPLISAVAYGDEDDDVIFLDDFIDENTMELNWQAPDGNWAIFVVYMGWHGKMVERAAPGGEGNVIDHFSTDAIKQYLEKFDHALSGNDTRSLRAYFNDSYEVDDAAGQSDWTPDLIDEFKIRRGYDLRHHLDDLFNPHRGEKHLRVRADFRETISDLLLERFTQSWRNWAVENGSIIRNQAHGSPSNILDLYAASHIPETEGTDIIKIKFASSAAHVANLPLVSAEAATWLDEHFLSDLGDLKQNLDRYFTGGVNHVVYHGTCYSPPGEEWPGRLFYAAIHANPRNPLWQDYPALNHYVARTQSLLQQGESDNDMLVYFPIHDRFAGPGLHMLEHFDGEGRSGRDDTPFRQLADQMQNEGFAFDFISDKQLQNLSVNNGKLYSGTQGYRGIVVPATNYMPAATLKKLEMLASLNIPVRFLSTLPHSIPGMAPDSLDRKLFTDAKSSLQGMNNLVIPELTRLGTTLKDAGFKKESLSSEGLTFTRRKVTDGYIYFVANWKEEIVDKYIPLSVNHASITLFDPMTGRTGLAQLDASGSSVRLRLYPGQSIIVKTSDHDINGKEWAYMQPSNEKIVLNGTWHVKFENGGPNLPSSKNIDAPEYWTEWKKDDYQNFSGTANYSTQFTAPDDCGEGLLLKAAEISESASVYINEHYVGSIIGPSFALFIPASLIKNKSTIEIKVSNSMANRIIYLEKNEVPWKNFYNINFPSRLAENRGPDGLFTAKNWSILPSGLKGPVTLSVIK